MSNVKSWMLTDVDSRVHVDSWSITNQDLGLPASPSWSVRKRTLRGGLSDGVELIEVDNGELSFSILPTRGMGIWRGNFRGCSLGWKSPVRGPVHPAYVDELANGGIGWIGGFDEWIVRCGLNYNGAPGSDVVLDNNGNPQEMTLPLHGRIANLPAHQLEVRIDTEPPHRIEVIGYVDEAMLFFPQLRLGSIVSTIPGSNSMKIQDTITNLGSSPSELELLYHCNFGPPILSEGARFLAPIKWVAPRDAVAQEQVDRFSTYPGPTAGVIEAVFWMELLTEPGTDRTLAVLRNAAGDKACGLRFSKKQLPWFSLWKNPGAESDGYVTGLEPATNLPNTRRFERQQGRVIELEPGGSYEAELVIEVADGPGEVEKLLGQVEQIQAQASSNVHREPLGEYSDL